MFCRSLSQKNHKFKITNKQTYAKHKNNTFMPCNRKKRLCKKRVCLHRIRRFKKHNKKCINKQWRREVRKLGSLIRLLINATASQPIATGTAVSISFTNIVNRFFSVIPAGTVNTATIPATDFTDDNDNPLGANGLPNGIPASGYVNIYVDGVLQQGSLLTSLTDTTLVLTSLPTPFTVGAPIALEVVSFENIATNVTNPTISAPIITVTS